MPERLPPAIALLIAFVLWSTGLVLLALTVDLGGRVGPHPDDPARAPPLPELPAEPAAAVAVTEDLAAGVAARPLFLATRRPAPVAPVDGPATAPFAGVLSSVLIAGDVRMAIFTEEGKPGAQRVRLGEAIPGTAWRLAGLQPRSAVIEGPEGRRVLDLRVFNGQGGAPPTAITPPTAAPASSTPAGGVAATPPPAASAPAPGQPAAPVTAGAAAPSADEQAQIEAIRQRIAARRAQLQQQRQNASAEPAPSEDK